MRLPEDLRDASMYGLVVPCVASVDDARPGFRLSNLLVFGKSTTKNGKSTGEGWIFYSSMFDSIPDEQIRQLVEIIDVRNFVEPKALPDKDGKQLVGRVAPRKACP